MEDSGLLYHAFIYLLTAVITVPIAKKIGLGSVLGYLLAGVLIGPFGLGVIRQAEHIMHIAEFGVVLMLFIIGLELRPSLLWKMRGPIVGLGGMQVSLTATAIAIIGLALGVPLTAAIAIGLILAMSSTAIVLQSLTEKGLLKTHAGQHAFSVLLFQDIAVIPILALIPFLGSGDTQSDAGLLPISGWARGVVILGLIAFIVLAGQFLARPIFRIIAQSRTRELFTAFALLIVIGIALAMQAVGLSAALGTFLAGVVLAESEYRHALESDIEPFKGLLLGLFFISVGAGIDFALVTAQWLEIAAIVAGLVSLKLAILFGLGKLYKLSVSDRFLFSFSLAQGGEFAFVLATFALDHGVFGPAMSDKLVASVAISMLTTPLLLIAYEKLIQPRLAQTRKAAQQDSPTEFHSNPVIIAGFGRFGQIVGRLLHANGIGTTVLDHDPSQIELLRKFDFKVFYGDATRLDLLRAAGAEDAVLLVVALDDAQASVTLVDKIQREYPHLKILARAPGRLDAYELLQRDVEGVYRETFGSALDMGIHALRILGFSAVKALRAGRLFRRHDERALRELAALRHDESAYVPRVKQLRAELDKLFVEDNKDRDQLEGRGGKNAPKHDRD